MARFNVDFSEETLARLEELARRSGSTKADVLRRAIQLEVWFSETTAAGSKILVETDGTVREVLKL